MPIADPDYIIAIGASAGGMEEINSFFDHTPLDGVSYIIIQHLSSDFKSRMVELLAKHSKLLVKEAVDDMMVRCNEVYLIPHNKYMTIQNGKLYLDNKDKSYTAHLTINRFFTSLAADCGEKAIGIIFSGLGSDGTEGITAIKNAGGMVMARNPENSEFGSMPSHAIATGLVDFILEPELMPNAIEDYIQYGSDLSSDHKDDQRDLAGIIDFIKEKSPLDFTDYKQTTILRRTKRRAASNNFKTLGNYLDFLKSAPEEVEALTRDFLISVTSFFRDKEAFDIIQKNILPEILERLTPGEELKMWVAGCASGEEVYSLAILISEQLTGRFHDTIVKIFATDIDGAALARAGKGVYNESIVKNVSHERIESCFLKEGDTYRIKPSIRKMVIFAQHDLVKNPPYCNMHFISCRNLLIYMTPGLQKKIYLMLLFGLKKDGYLFLGSSENPMPIIKSLEVVNKKWKIYKNLEAKRTLHFDAFSLPDLLEVKRSTSLPARENQSKVTSQTLADTISEHLATELDYLAICIDENNQVVKSYGNMAKFLLQKYFTSDLISLLPKPLGIAFNTLIKKVVKTDQKAGVSRIKIKSGEALIELSLSVSPLATKKGEQRFFIVTFTENKSAISIDQFTKFDESVYLNQYTSNLEEELNELKDKLHTSHEQLDASNENMQSFNEELISTNEEMQSTNEEMQSVNEELDTINADYQLKNKELLEINDDLNNYFRSNVNGQLFINNDLLLMKFSPGTVKQINLLESDIGRPLSNISTNIKFETILDDIKKVLAEGTVITKEIETNNGKWYQIMTMPYVQQADNKNNGAIITFNDITELKQTQEELANKNNSLLRINADLDNFAHTASHDLLGPLSNIELSISVINKKITDPELNKLLTAVNSSVKKFSTLIKDIGTVAKLESDVMELVDLDEILNNIEWSLENKIHLSGAVLIRNLEVKKILFSKKNLRSIIYNLISNAIKFKGEESLIITISTKQNLDHIILTVQDNGIGISKEGMEKIFEMYGRLNQDIEGHGIGLYLAKKIVHAAGGNILVESDPGKGSQFIIHFSTKREVQTVEI
jgi:two-component system CheB/CheR fusion protein